MHSIARALRASAAPRKERPEPGVDAGPRSSARACQRARLYHRPGRPYKGRYMYKPLSEFGLAEALSKSRSQTERPGDGFYRPTIPDAPVPVTKQIERSECFLTKVSSQGLRGCAVIYFNRWRTENALDSECIERLEGLVRKHIDNALYNSVMWRSAGDYLCTGTDLYSQFLQLESENGVEKVRKFYANLQKTAYSIASSNKPIIVLMKNDVLGPGAGLALSSTIPITCESTRICAPGCSIGLVGCEAGLSYRLSRLPHRLGEYLLVSGRSIESSDLFHVGLSDYFIPSDRTDLVEEKLLNFEKTTHQDIRDAINILHDVPDESKIKSYIRSIERCFSKPTVSDIVDALERETENVQWAQYTLARMKKNCPLSMSLTLHSVRLARYLPLSNCLQMEYTLLSRMVQSPEFREGLAAFVEGRTPCWPTQLCTNQDELSKYFTPLVPNEQLTLLDSPDPSRLPRFLSPTSLTSSSPPRSSDYLKAEKWGGPFADGDQVRRFANQQLISIAGSVLYNDLLEYEERVSDAHAKLKSRGRKHIYHTSSN